MSTTATSMQGEAGNIEMLVDQPPEVRGIAVVAHPHPQQGGSATHKVPHTLARTLVARGYLTVRPNFRGVGASEGEHDAGRGETDDMVAVVDHLRRSHPGLPLVLAGFSFGAFVIARVAEALRRLGTPCPHLILAGTPWGNIHGFEYDTPAVPATALVVHGEQDDRVVLGAVMEWARPQALPVVVLTISSRASSPSWVAWLAAISTASEGRILTATADREDPVQSIYTTNIL